MNLILSKIITCCFKNKSLPSFHEYMYEKDISKESWKANIKYFFKIIKLQWLPNYDRMMEDIYELYNDIPFHNHCHVYDVFQLGICLLVRNEQPLIGITELEKITFCIALLCHDLDHRGYTNSDIENDSFIYSDDDIHYSDLGDDDSDLNDEIKQMKNISYCSSISSVCSSSSYNEKHHIKCSHKILEKNNVKYDQRLFAKLISYTDLSQHNGFLNKTEYVKFFGKKQKNEHILILLIKLADIGHILRPWEIHSEFVCSMNKERHFPLEKDLLPNDTIYFNTTFVLPLIYKVKDVNIGLSYKLLQLYNKNIAKWSYIQKWIDKST